MKLEVLAPRLWLMQSVKGNRLPAQFLNDKSYINVVEWELMSLSRDLANSNLNYEI